MAQRFDATLTDALLQLERAAHSSNVAHAELTCAFEQAQKAQTATLTLQRGCYMAAMRTFLVLDLGLHVVNGV